VVSGIISHLAFICTEGEGVGVTLIPRRNSEQLKPRWLPVTQALNLDDVMEKSGDCEQSKNIHKVQKTENMPFI